MIVKSADQLRELVRRILLAVGADEPNADGVAEHLVLANLSGVDTHGVWHVAGYVADVQKGCIVPTAWPQIVKQTPTSALISGNWAFGHLTARYGMEIGIGKARSAGVAVVSLVQANHIGRLGHYAEMAAAEGMISMIWGGGYGVITPRTVPYGGRRPVLDTNPISIGVPAGEQSPMIMDFATTAVSGVKVVNAHRRHEKLPPGCIVDKDGRPSTDPNDFYDDGAFVAFGEHKGYAIMLAAELIGRIFAGADAFAQPDRGTTLMRHQGVTMIVFKADLFQPYSDFGGRVDEMGQRTRAIPPASGFKEVLIPGDMEARCRADRQRDGIPIADDVWQTVVDAAASVGITDVG